MSLPYAIESSDMDQRRKYIVLYVYIQVNKRIEVYE